MEQEQLSENEIFWQKEIEKCRADPYYFYFNYWLIDNKKPVIRDVTRITEPFA